MLLTSSARVAADLGGLFDKMTHLHHQKVRASRHHAFFRPCVLQLSIY